MKRSFPEKWAQAVEATEYDQETLRKAAWVASRVPRGTRRESLPYRHHEVIAALPPEEQKQWLDASEPEREGEPPRYSSRELSSAIKKEEKGGREEETDTETCPRCGGAGEIVVEK